VQRKVHAVDSAEYSLGSKFRYAAERFRSAQDNVERRDACCAWLSLSLKALMRAGMPPEDAEPLTTLLAALTDLQEDIVSPLFIPANPKKKTKTSLEWLIRKSLVVAVTAQMKCGQREDIARRKVVADTRKRAPDSRFVRELNEKSLRVWRDEGARAGVIQGAPGGYHHSIVPLMEERVLQDPLAGYETAIAVAVEHIALLG
jgi:hypothetical protein